jgi:hypothetical protein
MAESSGILITVSVIVFGLGIIANHSPEATYVSNAVTGLTPTSEILIAFLGF